MRNITKILIGFVLSLFLCGSLFAQNKIAGVDTDAFYDEKSGIKILTNAVISTYDDDFDTPRIRKRVVELKVEIQRLKTLTKPVESQELEIAKLEAELQKRQELYEKRRSILFEPLLKKIQSKLEIFSTQKGYTKIIDLSDDKSINAVLYFDESIDKTTEFIKFCNEEFEKEKSAK
jgi:Skp family chaperone for outer membrane proteins